MDLLSSAIAAASNPKYSKYLAPALLLLDAILSTFVLLNVQCNLSPTLSIFRWQPLASFLKLDAIYWPLDAPDTEIDWKAYMEQVALYLSGELDYVKLKGSTGPLVYPAGHVYIYSVLYKLTDQGRNIFTAQLVFTGVYLLTLGIVLAVYLKAKVSFVPGSEKSIVSTFIHTIIFSSLFILFNFFPT